MNFDELMTAILKILPEASFDEDNDGQIVIYTNMEETIDGTLIPFTEEN